MPSAATMDHNTVPGPAGNRDPERGDSPKVVPGIGDLSTGPAHAPGRRVLIAEDDSALRRTLNLLVGIQGYSIVEAEDGEEALGILASSLIDILILDLAMPRLDGIELLRRIEAPPPLVIIYSAFEYYTPDEVHHQVGSKVFRYLRKPVPPRQLISALADAAGELA